MKPVFIPHSDYQAFVLLQLRTSYGSGVVLIPKDWPLAVKLWMTDLSAVTTLLLDDYSPQGPIPRDPNNDQRFELEYLVDRDDELERLSE